MKKTIRLTESDLVRLVKRIVNEQDEPKKFIPGVKDSPKPEEPRRPIPDDPKSRPGYTEKRLFDKMVGGCLENAGFTVKYGKNPGQYALDAFKKGTSKGDYNVRSVPTDPSKFIYTLRTPEGKIAEKVISVNSSTTCKSIVP